MIQLVWLVPLLPLIGFLINGLFRKQLSKALVGIVGSGTVLGSFIVSLMIFFEINGMGNTFAGQEVFLFDFISAGTLRLPFSFWVDQLSSVFLLVITGVGFLIHVYSTGYMHEDEGFAKFFAYLNLFVFSMLLLVLGANYVIMFIGWEGVGLCSYLLIGFWYKNIEYTNAAKKAFIMNRIGDLGFLIGMFLLFAQFGTLNYTELFPKVGMAGADAANFNLIAICLFVGAMGKSAQVPLYTWLPDAMAGPTPVSALIHAATMVTAGIYMVVRSNVVYSFAIDAQHFVAIIGVVTALLAATIAIKQNDIKKVLAYSTVSQLGFMFLALGVGAYTTAVFHVITHAFFKALMFLGSGSVIHAMGGEQDIRKMGGLKKQMPITYYTFLIGCLAIAGIIPFSGFFSKDEILMHVFEHNKVLYGLAVAAAMMTAFYMFRLLFVTFHGKFRGTHEQEHHLHESPASMTFPLIVLAILSLAGGAIGIPEVMGGHNWLSHFLGAVIVGHGAGHEAALSHSEELVLMAVAMGLALVAILGAWSYFKGYNAEKESSGLGKVMENKWYVDELYDAIVVKPLKALSGFLNNVIEKLGIDGLVNGVGKTVNWGGQQLRLLQNGQVGFYLFFMVIGMALLFILSVFIIN
jgi:NADH-quinone oxidoreductase subunit L